MRDAGLRVAVVTNSATEAGEGSVAAAGLRDLVEVVIGTDGVGAFKPDPRVYANAAHALGAQPTELTLVAAHAWDLQGAGRAGWRTAWVGHLEERLLGTVEVDITGATLTDVVAELVR